MRFIAINHSYLVKLDNEELLDILSKGYYMELGIVPYPILEHLLKRHSVDLNDLLAPELINIGLGNISKDSNDYIYQLLFLHSLKAKNSSNQFFLTVNELHYKENGEEKYAPILLLPVTIDFEKSKLYPVDDVIVNPLLVNILTQKNLRENVDKKNINAFKEDIFEISSLYSLPKITSCFSADKYGEELAKKLNMEFELSNYLTVSSLDFPDIEFDKDYFTVQSSIYETNSFEVMKKFYTSDFKSTTPLNIEQKYIINKVLQKENFVVNGKLGSGKTTTIVNVMLDFVGRGKKVLYINNDLTNIESIHSTIAKMGFENVVSDLNHSPFKNAIISSSTVEQKNVDILPQLLVVKKYQDYLSGKIHGYIFSDLLEKISILKANNPSIQSIPVETTLERYEIESIQKDLEIVEKDLKIVDDFKSNIWILLHCSQNNNFAKDIVDKTKRFQEIQQKFYKQNIDFSKKYNLVLPRSSSDFYQLGLEMASFQIVRPLACWSQVENRKKAFDTLQELATLSDRNFNCLSYYKESVAPTYKPGKAISLYKELCGKYLLDEPADSIYISRLLVNPEAMNSLISRLTDNLHTLIQLTNRLKQIFNIEKINPTFLSFIKKVSPLALDENCASVYENFLTTPFESFMGSCRFIEQMQTEIQGVYKDSIFPYLLNDDLSWKEYHDIVQSFKSNKEFKRIIKKQFLHQKNFIDSTIVPASLKIDKLYQELLSYLSISYEQNKLEEILTTLLRVFHKLEKFNDKEISMLLTLLKKFKKSGKIQLLDIDDLLSNFENALGSWTKLSEELLFYKIDITKLTLEQVIATENEVIEYLQKAMSIQKELLSIFVLKKTLSSNDLFELIKMDDDFLSIQNKVTIERSNYNYLFGSNYHGFDTVVSEIVQSLEHFEHFYERLKNPLELENMLSLHFVDISNDVEQMTTVYNAWVVSMRAFSKCFVGGKIDLQDKPLQMVSDILSHYSLKLNQVDSTLEIIDKITRMEEFGLHNIASGIHSGEYKEQIANRFLYSCLSNYRLSYENMHPNFELSNIVTEYNTLYDMEKTLANNHIFQLREKLKNIHLNPKIKNLSLQSKWIQESNFKTPMIVLCDINTLNRTIDIKDFALVIVDDAQLENVTKYYRIPQANQLLVFGDKQFRSSISNGLMQRLNDEYVVNLSHRYVEMSSRFNNPWSYENQYIYSLKVLVTLDKVGSLDEFVDKVLFYYKEKPKSIMNIVVATLATKKSITSLIIDKLNQQLSLENIVDLLAHEIMIINGEYEAARYAEHVFIYYDDFKDMDLVFKSLVFSNFAVASSSVEVYYVSKEDEQYNLKIVKDINNLIGKTKPVDRVLTGISLKLFNRLAIRYTKTLIGFGGFDVVMKSKKNIGICILNKYNSHNFSNYDEYIYYKTEYEKNGWQVVAFTLDELANNFDDIVTSLLNLANGGSTDGAKS